MFEEFSISRRKATVCVSGLQPSARTTSRACANLLFGIPIIPDFTFSSCSKEEEEAASEVGASPEMVQSVEELEAEIRRVKEEEGEAAACEAVEEAEHTESAENTEGEHSGDDHHGASGTLDRIASMREELAGCGQDYLGFYHLECVSFEELE